MTLEEKLEFLRAEGWQRIDIVAAFQSKWGGVKVILTDGRIIENHPRNERVQMPGGEGRLMPCIPPTKP